MRIAVVIPTNGKREAWLELVYLHYSRQPERVDLHICRGGTNSFEPILDILPDIEADYVVFSGDDDFHFPAQLHYMADYLDDSPDLIGVYGDALLMGLDGFGIQWSCIYPSMFQERVFSMLRRDVFKKCVEAAVMAAKYETPGMTARERNDLAANHFNAACALSGDRLHIGGLQLIRGHHEGRGQERKEPAWRLAVEKYGGGWLASWLPSRSGSLRALKRSSNPHHDEFVEFKNLMDDFRERYRLKEILSENTLHHPV